MIRHISAIKILEEYQTEGSRPLKVIGEDDKLYVAKFTSNKPQRKEIINELICGFLAKSWGLNVPEIVIISFNREVVGAFSYSDRYKPEYFEQEFFGSQLIESVIELERYMGEVSKIQYQAFENPLDLLLIGCFDHWIGNVDRKPNNPNVLISVDNFGKFHWHPIDHTAAFAHQEYKNVRDIMVRVDKTILQCGFVRSICKYTNKKVLENLHKNIDLCINNALEGIDDIIDQIPKSWGFGKKSKLKIKSFLSDKTRNENIAHTYLQYLK